MASKSKHEKGAKQESNSPQDLIDTLTKEEKEALLNKKMEEIRKRNEERQRRYAEIEADRKAAEEMGRAVSLKPLSQEADSIVNRTQTSEAGHQKEQTESGSKTKLERRKSDSKSKPAQAGGKPRSPSYKDETSKIENNVPASRKRQNDEKSNTASKQNTMKGVRDKEGPPGRSMGRGKRLTQMSQQKLKAEEYDKSKQEATAESDSKKSPPPDPGYKFLADPQREKSLPDSSRGESTRRHPRNFGGTSFDNVKNKIKAEKEKYGRFQSGPPQTKLDMTIQMTGKERREYAQWRAERERIDRERLQRQKSAEGMWKREWDMGKKEQSPPTPPMSRKMEPGRRPAGRIGSGRFAAGEPDERAVKGQRDDSGSGRGRAKRGRDTAAIWSRGRGSESHQVRGRSRGVRQSHSSSDSIENTEGLAQSEPNKAKQDNPELSPKRFRLSSQVSDDGSRHVKQQNDKLVIQIDNEFASSKSPTTANKSFSDFDGSQGKDFSFQLPGSSDQVKFDGFHGKPSSRGDFRSGRRGGGRGRGERRRSMDRKGNKSAKPGRGKTVTFQTQPVVHTPDLEWDHDPEMKQDGAPASDWKQDLADASAQNWNDSEDAAKAWEVEAAVGVAECDGEYMEDQYIMGHEETYTEMKKKRAKPKKRKARILPKPKPKEITGFVDENGEPVDEKDAEWLDEEELLTNQAEDDGGEVADSGLHDSSAESLERFIQEHTLQLNIDARTGDISLENSLPSSQQSGASEDSPRHRPASQRESPHSGRDSQPRASDAKTPSASQTSTVLSEPSEIMAPSTAKSESNNEEVKQSSGAKQEAKDAGSKPYHEDDSQETLQGSPQDNPEKTCDAADGTKSEKTEETVRTDEDTTQEQQDVTEVAEVGEPLKEEQPVSDVNEGLKEGQAVSKVAEDELVLKADVVSNDTETQDNADDDDDSCNKVSSSEDTRTTETVQETDKSKETSSGLEKDESDDTEKSSERTTNKTNGAVEASEGDLVSAAADADVVCLSAASNEAEATETGASGEKITEERHDTSQETGHGSDVASAEGGQCNNVNELDEKIKEGSANEGIDTGHNQQQQQQQPSSRDDDLQGAGVDSQAERALDENKTTAEAHNGNGSSPACAESAQETETIAAHTGEAQTTLDQNTLPEKDLPSACEGDALLKPDEGGSSSGQFALPNGSNKPDADHNGNDAVATPEQSADDQTDTSNGRATAPVES